MGYFLSIGFKNLHLFVNCHSTLFKWVIFTLFEIYKYYICIVFLFEFMVKICY